MGTALLLWRGPAKAGPSRSILVVVPVRGECEVHEPVHIGTIGKKPDDVASIVDPVDHSTHHAECWCLRRTGGIESKERPCKENEPVHLAKLIDEGAATDYRKAKLTRSPPTIER